MAAPPPPNFDARLVPVVRTDAHLEVVAAHQLLPDALRARFRVPPLHWTPELSTEGRFTERAPAHAAVLVPVVMREHPTVLLTQRTTHLSSHSGQIAFPGGKTDPHDKDAAATALREASEEVGLDPKYAEVLGTLPIYTTGSAYLVTPVIALVHADVQWTANPHEVADLFEVPLAFLMNPAHHRHHAMDWAGATRHWLSMPYQDGATERFIWGATAGMLRNLYGFLKA
jgi:8-oxo-dGTP pyrophosphatase MutT (NUDIX family)